MKTPKRTLTIKASQIQKAVARAKARCPRDWQAEILEILLIPSVYRRWQSVNDHSTVEIKRHDGFPFAGGREEALAVEDWTVYAGYEYGYGLERLCWNRARSDWYGHSPSSAWDGVRRETYHSFAESLRMAYDFAVKGEPVHWRTEDNLRQYKIRFVNDL